MLHCVETCHPYQFARDTFNILKSLANNLHHSLVLTCAATALRSAWTQYAYT